MRFFLLGSGKDSFKMFPFSFLVPLLLRVSLFAIHITINCMFNFGHCFGVYYQEAFLITYDINGETSKRRY